MLGKMLYAVVRKTKTCKLLRVRIEHHLVLTFRHEDTVVGEGLLTIPVEDEQQIATRIRHYLVTLVVPPFHHPWQVVADVVFLLFCRRFLDQQVLLQ